MFNRTQHIKTQKRIVASKVPIVNSEDSNLKAIKHK